MNREEIRIRLDQIEAATGRLTPEAVVEDAKDPSSPLHGLFEWDVDKAAHAHWLARARSIIASVRVEIITNEVTMLAPAYVRDPRVSPREQGYVAVGALKGNREAARTAALSELRQAEAALNRAHAVAAILSVEEDVEDARQKVRKLRDRVAAEVRVSA